MGFAVGFWQCGVVGGSFQYEKRPGVQAGVDEEQGDYRDEKEGGDDLAAIDFHTGSHQPEAGENLSDVLAQPAKGFQIVPFHRRSDDADEKPDSDGSNHKQWDR